MKAPYEGRLRGKTYARLPVRAGVHAFPFVLLLLLSGCVVYPVPVPKKVKNPSGIERTLDLTFIQPGKTTRGEIEKSLAWIDTGCKDPRLFWGRWYKSSVWIMGAGATGGGYAGRLWGDQNLLVEFDDAGIVRHSEVVPDKALSTKLEAWLRDFREPPLDLSTAQVIEVRFLDAREQALPSTSILLSVASLQLTPPNSAGFSVPRQNVRRLEAAEVGDVDTAIGEEKPKDLGYLVAIFHFSEKTPLGKTLAVQVVPLDYLKLVRYFAKSSESKE